MKGNFFQNRIVLLQLKTLSGVLTVLGGNVAGGAGHTTVLMLCALHDYLDAIAFLCHVVFRKTECKGKRIFILPDPVNEKKSVPGKAGRFRGAELRDFFNHYSLNTSLLPILREQKTGNYC